MLRPLLFENQQSGAAIGIALCPYCSLVHSDFVPKATQFNDGSVCCLNCGRMAALPLPRSAMGLFKNYQTVRDAVGSLLTIPIPTNCDTSFIDTPFCFEARVENRKYHTYHLSRHFVHQGEQRESALYLSVVEYPPDDFLISKEATIWVGQDNAVATKLTDARFDH